MKTKEEKILEVIKRKQYVLHFDGEINALAKDISNLFDQETAQLKQEVADQKQTIADLRRRLDECTRKRLERK